jgi:hypothetical protein
MSKWRRGGQVHLSHAWISCSNLERSQEWAKMLVVAHGQLTWLQEATWYERGCGTELSAAAAGMLTLMSVSSPQLGEVSQKM